MTSRARQGSRLVTAYDTGGLGMRNRIINGDMRIDQRNNGASVTLGVGLTYTLDRWQAQSEQASKYSVQRSTVAPAGFTNSVIATSLTAHTIVSSDRYVVRQNVEGFNVADLGWGTANAQPVTISFWVRSSLTGSFGGYIGNSAIDRSYPFSYTINAANTFEYKTITIPGDTTGTWLTNNDTGIRLGFSLGIGSDYAGTAGAWTSAQRLAPAGSVSVVSTNGATFYITGVQLEAGSVATPFERRPYGTEEILCTRYFQILQLFQQGGFVNSYPIEMRASVTIVRTGIHPGTGAAGGNLVDGAYGGKSIVIGNNQSSTSWGGTYTLSAEL